MEINLERQPRLKRIFDPDNRPTMLADVGLAVGKRLDSSRHLLFIDEIQAAPAAISALRWFFEDTPELPLVAAGSLLDFALSTSDYSVPVGRLTYRYLEPMSFEEYLLAHSEELLLERLRSWTPGEVLSSTVFDKASDRYHRFSQVGGMPEVVAADESEEGPSACRRIQSDLMAMFRDDFAKYARRLDPGVLDTVLLSAARQLGSKFVYSRASEDVKHAQMKSALELLAMARVVTLVPHTAGNGLPLGGEVNDRYRKAFLLDVGMLHALIGTPADPEFARHEDIAPAIRGQLAEQLAAQQLRGMERDGSVGPALHYWQRMGGRTGEVDFLCQIGTRIIPVEIKAGAAGAMKSLHQFMHDKGLGLAVRVDANPPSIQDVRVKTTQGDPVAYRLLSVPGFLLFRVREIIEAMP